MKNSIYPCIWCQNNAKEMADFYLSVFPESEITNENPYFVTFTINQQRIMLLNGAGKADSIRPNPSISLMYLTPSEHEVDSIHEKLMEGGKELMPLDSYPFSSKYAWVEDRYGVSWQLYTGKAEDIIQKVVPTLMFVGNNNGKAAEAIDFYTSLFPGSRKRGVLQYTGEEGETAGNIQHAEFTIDEYLLMIMDSSYPHAFNFTEGISLVVEVAEQENIDYYWDRFISNGGVEGVCGWLKDKYGVSWQVFSFEGVELVLRSPKALQAMQQMVKLDLNVIRDAAQNDPDYYDPAIQGI